MTKDYHSQRTLAYRSKPILVFISQVYSNCIQIEIPSYVMQFLVTLAHKFLRPIWSKINSYMFVSTLLVSPNITISILYPNGSYNNIQRIIFGIIAFYLCTHSLLNYCDKRMLGQYPSHL